MKLGWLFLTMSLAGGLLQSRAADAPAPVDPSIETFVQTYFSSWSQSDFARYRSCFHPEASLDLKTDGAWKRWGMKEFFAAQEAIQARMHSQEVPLAVRVKARGAETAMVEVPWKLIRSGGGPSVTGFDWYTLVKGGPVGWQILHLTFWEDEAAGKPAAAESAPVGKPKIIVSGFEGFGGRTINASAELAKAMAAEFPQYELSFVQVPVVWGAPMETIAQHRAERPVAWLAFGEGGATFHVETVATNQRGDHKDNAQHTPPAPEIVPGGPEKLMLGSPALELCERLKRAGYQCGVSQDAGKYLCEEMLYSLLREQQTAESTLKQVLFIHVPPYGTTIQLHGRRAPFIDSAMPEVARDLFAAINDVLHLTESN